MTTDVSPGTKPLVVLGIGNPPYSDEGAGIRAIDELRKQKWPEEVVFLTSTAGGLELLQLLEGAQQAIIIDCLDAGVAPGTIFKFEPKDLHAFLDKSPLSFNSADFIHGITVSRDAVRHPPTVVFGIQVNNRGPGFELSPEINAKLSILVKMVSDTICEMLCLEPEIE